MQKKRVWIGIVAIILAFAALVAGILLYQKQKQVHLRNEALEELVRNVGQYDEQSIVLNNTSKAKAEELAQLYGAQLRITENGRFATLTLPEGTTIRDVYAMDESLKYIEDMAADYQVQTSELETEEEKDGERLPVRPQYSVSDTDYELQTYLDYLNMGAVWNSYTGAGVTVAVIDTGIDTDHPEFAGRISEYSYNATEDKIVKDYLLEDGSYDWSLIEDEVGHGTAVTGVIAASMNSDRIVGIAPNVNIIVIKAECNENGQFKRASDLVFGLYYAIERDVQIVNMSFGGSQNIYAEAAQLAYDSDIICVAAAGNGTTSALHYPAADKNVIGVGALGDGWTLADYSNYGENTDLVAPGSTYTCQLDGGYEMAEGTSLSAPIVAGAIALYMQTDRYTTFDKVTEILYASCYDLGDLGRDWYYGFGALDISAFILEERGTIIYDMLTDELENEEGVYIQGHTLQELPEPERLYAVFDGWYYDDTFTQEYNYYEDKFYGDEITLYAKWVNEDDGVPYTYVVLDDGTVEIRSYTGHRRYITIPETIEGRIVSSIGDFAFSGQTRLREVGFPAGLIHIGLCAFENCANLVSVQIPANVTEIEEYAFSGNVRLSSVAFEGDSKLETIGDFVFQNCGKLERIELPAALKNVDGSAFVGATALHSITVENGNTSFSSKEGVLFNYSGSTLVVFPAAWGSTYTLPEGTVYIGDYSFAFAKLRQIELGGVQSVGEFAFTMAALETLTIPDGVTAVAAGAFSNNANLSQLTIGSGLTQIKTTVFANTRSLKTVTIPENIAQIGSGAFCGSGLESVFFGENSALTMIGNNAFAGCNISNIEIPASVLEIGSGAFKGNPLVHVGFGENSDLHTIGESAFANCWLLETIELPAGLLTIGDFAFQSSGLTKVTVPAGVTHIGDGAFSLCGDLTAVTVEAGNTVYHDIDGVVYTLDNTTIHTYPAGKAEENYILEMTTEVVAPWAFAGAQNLVTVQLPEGLTQISEYGFAYCSNMQYIHIPDNVLQIGRYAFAYDWNLYSVTFNETSKLPRISFGSFAYSGLTSFTAPANVSTMAQKVFEGCRNLTSFTFAENSKLESISAYMFDGCSNLQSITFNNGSALTSIQAHGLEGMDKLTNIDFGDAKLTNVDNFAFRFCESLSTLNLPETVTNIGRYAFYGCKSLSELTIPANVEHIGSYAFLGTGDLELYFANEILPLYLDENWDHAIKAYYTGVTSVQENGDWKYATLTSGNVAILEYLGEETQVDLTTVDLGAPITIIGGSAFKDSTVTSIVLPDTLTAIQAEAFAYSKLTSVTIPANVTFIGRQAFAYTDIATLTFAAGSKLSVMEQYAFEGTKHLTAVILPASLTTMGTGVFLESGLTSVTFEEGIAITEIPQKAFAETKLTSVSLPDSVTLVNHNAFNNVQTLKSVSFGNNEGIRLMNNAFYRTGLESLHIPANVTYIGEYCFVALSNLTEFSVDENNPNYTAVDGLLLTKTGRKLIAVPAGRTGSLTVPESVEEIGFGAFEESKLSEILFREGANILTFGYRAFFKAENITSIVIPKSVVSIDYYAFAYCENLKEVVFTEGNQLKGIYEGAFLGCINLENITVPDAIVEISDFAFYGCSKIDELPIYENNGIKGIYDYAFAYTGLKGEFTTPETLMDIGNYAFLGTKLTKVTIPDTNKKDLIIGIGAFEDCNEITEITLPFIGASYEDEEISWFGYIFGAGSYEANETYVPKSLKTVTITDGITFIGIGGFSQCKSLETINVPQSISVLYNNAFLDTTARYELSGVITTVWQYFPGYAIKCAQQSHFGRGISGKLEIAQDVDVSSGNLFFDCIGLEEVVLPEGMTSISVFMFRGCRTLKRVNIPSTVTTIGEGAFSNCTSLTEIVLPEGITVIESSAFAGVPLTKIVLPSTLQKIDDWAFSGCANLYEIHNNSAIDLRIGAYPDHGCVASNARVIIDAEGNKIYREEGADFEFIDTEDGFRFVRENDEYCLVAYVGEENAIRLPETIKGNSYTIKNFGGVTTVTIPGSFQKIDDEAFQGFMVVNVILEEGITEIGMRAFSGSPLKTVSLPSTLVSIGDSAFSDCHYLETINIPSSVSYIGDYAFNCCYKLKEISIPYGITRLKSGVFQWCFNLEEVYIPETVTAIETNAFLRCEKLSSIEIPESVTSIAQGAFSQCISLECIVLPEKITELGEIAFSANTELVLPDDNENFQLVDGILYDVPATKILHVSQNIPEDLTILPGITEIPAYAFQECQGIKNVTLPEGVTVLQEGAFQNSSLETIHLPESLITIGSAFYDCKQLRNVNIPEGVIHIGGNAFRECTSLDKIVLPDGLQYLGSYAFSGCISLSGINIPAGITRIEAHTFGMCAFSKIVIPDTVTEIGDWAFSGCTNATELVISESVTKIGEGAFNCCYGLITVEIPNSLSVISESAFSTCINLRKVTLGNGVTEIGEYAFAYCKNIREIVNNSAIDLQFGSNEYGEIAVYANVIIDNDGQKHILDSNLDFEIIETEDGFRFIREDGKYTLVAYIGTENVITLPINIQGQPYELYRFTGALKVIVPEGLERLSDEAFAGNSVIVEVLLPSSLKTIGAYAFSGCSNLSDVIIPDGVTEIGAGAFSGCKKFETIVIPNGVTSIEQQTFENCENLNNILIPDSVIKIGSASFGNCVGLYEIHLPGGLRIIDSSAFIDCENLTMIHIPQSVTEIGTCAFLRSGIENDASNWIDGLFIVDGWLLDVANDVRFLSNMEKIDHVANDVYRECYLLKNAIWDEYVFNTTNIETVYIREINELTPCLHNSQTLKNIVICDSVGAADLRYCEWLFTINNVTGVTIYVEALEKDLRWDDNFPGWNNGNVVVYGDKWNYVNFYDADGKLIGAEPKRNSEIIRRPVLDLPDNTEGYTYEFLGWDLDGDGEVDSIPATTTVDIHAMAVVRKSHFHVYGNWEVIEVATCTEEGAEQRNCKYCDYYETRTVTATGHSYTSVVTTPTCTEQGYTTHTCHCGDSYIDSYVDALGHSYGEWYVTKDATCTEDGQQRHDCQNCDHHETEDIAAIGHSYTSVVTDPTCTEQGYTTHTCHCGDSYIDSYVDALGHSYGEWYVTEEATCTEDGQQRHDCQNCDHYETEDIAATGHSYTAVVANPTCTEQGYTTHTCHCGDSYIDSYVDALGHSYGEWYVTKEATCTEDGQQRHDCQNCDHHENEVIAATGHSYEAVVTAPTCTEQGYTTHTCHCGDSYVDAYVDALGHDYGEWYVTEAATCTESGEERHDCSCCDHYETRVIAAKGHNFVDGVCTECGEKAFALGDVNGDGNVDTTDAKLIMQYDLGMIGEDALNLAAADTNGDGWIDTTDAKLIMQFDLGMIGQFPNARKTSASRAREKGVCCMIADVSGNQRLQKRVYAVHP